MTGVAFALFLGGVISASFIQKPPTTSTDWAAWVQAVGSIGAIVGAFYVGERQAKTGLRTALHLQDEAGRQRREAIRAIADAAAMQANEFSMFAGGKEVNKLAFYLVYDERKVTGLIDAISAVPVHTIGSSGSVKAWLALKVAMINFHNAVATYEQLLRGSAAKNFPVEGRGSAQLVIACNRAVDHQCRLFVESMGEG